MVVDEDQRSGSLSRKGATVPRSLSPDSPLPAVPAAHAVPCGGSVELQRLRSHVLPLEALGSSGSSSDDEQDISASLQAAAPVQQAPSPKGAGPPDLRACDGAAGDADGRVAAPQGAVREAPDAAQSPDSEPGPGRKVEAPPNATRAVANDQPTADPPFIRHGAGALAGLLQSLQESHAAEPSAATAERFRRATGLPCQPASAMTAGDETDGVRESAQRGAFASGKARVGNWGPVAGQASKQRSAATPTERRSHSLSDEPQQQLSGKASQSRGVTSGIADEAGGQVRGLMRRHQCVQHPIFREDEDTAFFSTSEAWHRPFHQHVDTALLLGRRRFRLCFPEIEMTDLIRGRRTQRQDGGQDPSEPASAQGHSPATPSAATARRGVSTAPSAGAATQPPSHPSLPQVRCSQHRSFTVLPAPSLAPPLTMRLLLHALIHIRIALIAAFLLQ